MYIPELTSSFVLENIDQKKVIEYYYGYEIDLDSKVYNIFRDTVDNNPGAWFEYYNNRLVIVDFADPKTNRSDVINLTRFRYNIGFNDALYFLYSRFIEGNDLKLDIEHKVSATKTVKVPTPIVYVPTIEFTSRDRDYWSQREITKANLLEDKISRCTYVEFYSTRLRKTIMRKTKPNELCYSFGHYVSRAVKIYRPEEKNDSFKFTTNVNQHDIGMLHTFDYNATYAILTKAYKDARILVNNDYNSLYLMNEHCYPSRDALWMLEYVDIIYLLMDNDFTGVVYASKLKEYLNKLFSNKEIVIVTYPFWKDTDAFFINDKKGLLDFLEDKIKFEVL